MSDDMLKYNDICYLILKKKDYESANKYQPLKIIPDFFTEYLTQNVIFCVKSNVTKHFYQNSFEVVEAEGG